MLKVNDEMLDNAGKLMNDKKICHMKVGQYDYFTSNHETVAVVKGAGSTRKVGQFNCEDYVIIDSYDFR